MAEANMFSHVNDFQVEEASQRRSKFTVGRVALGVLSLLLLAAVSALIGVIVHYNSSSTCEAKTEASTCSSVTLCDVGWWLNGTQCYYFSPIRLQLTWNSSKETCRSFSGDLIKIESTEEQEFVYGTVQHLMFEWADRFWIGLTDSETEGTWLWADGSPLDQSLQFWTKNEYNTEPDNWKEEDEDGENCATMGQLYYINGIKSWYDLSCKANMRFICKKRATTRSAACG